MTLPVQEKFVEVIQLVYGKIVRRVDASQFTGTLHGDSMAQIVMTSGACLKCNKLQVDSKIHQESSRGPRRIIDPSCGLCALLCCVVLCWVKKITQKKTPEHSSHESGYLPHRHHQLKISRITK